MVKAYKTLYAGVAAGVMVGVGGTVYLAAPDKTIGAALFAIGLLTICIYGMKLYTGAIGYLITDSRPPWPERAATGLTIWAGNYIGTTLYGTLLHPARPELAAKAAAMCELKLTQSLQYNLFMGVMCGLLMYLAVDVYKKQSGFGRYLGIIFAVPVFILAGFEHSIADMLYLAIAYGRLLPTAQVMGFLLTVTLGNSVGALFLPSLSRTMELTE